ncbi:MAG: hypothetical protein M3Y55_08735 [Pseudomonadota bacterium]|nr:hypothetical protein [Pseudomonadota bacterium]
MHPKRMLAAMLLFVAGAALAEQAPTVLLRGTIEKVDATTLVLKERDGRIIPLSYADDFSVNEVLPIDPAAIQSGTFVGTTAVSGADGTLSAVEVHVFPEAARGRGEGHRPWDLLPNSTMTNATVTKITSGPNERTMTLHYKDGEKTIRVPNGVPIVTMKPADRALLVAGAKVLVTEQMRNGQAVALRAQVGRNGFTPPM